MRKSKIITIEGLGEVTIKDIAKACGVSVSTVSRVLKNHPDVSDAVRRTVLAAAARNEADE